QGMGFPMFAILSGVCEMFARGIVGFIGVPLLGYVAACAASPLAWVVADMFLIPGFMYCIRRLKRVFADREPKEGFQYE
ncbi:MAG: MATE family efflux transporter, partial [Lachnoanaerobaculum saburreum]